MVYLLLTAAVLCVTVQNLIAKQYNASVKNPNTYMFSIYGIADKTGEAGMSSGQNCSHEYRRAVLEPGMGEL